MRNTVSVCIATYNGSNFIREQLASILPQLNENDEIIISDDSSTDQTLEEIKFFNDSRIKVFEGQKFKSPIFNFENAIKHANGRTIFLSDQDDVWLENKVSIMLNALSDHDLVVSNAFIGDDELRIIRDSYFDWRGSKQGILKNLIKNSYLGCSMAFDRKILSRVLPFPKNIPMHDMWIGMITEIFYKPIFIPDKLMIYRRHGGNTTILNEDYSSNETIKSKVIFRMNLVIAIIGRIFKKPKN